MTQLNLFGLTFNLYGLILGLAILASFQTSLWLAKERRIDPKIVEYLFWWVVAGGIIGARAYHVIDKWREIYSLNPQSAFYVWNGGLGIWGAILGGLLAYGIWHMAYGKKFKIEVFQMLDVILFGVPLGQAIGRWGNYFNNEIVGKNGEPLFFYESIFDLILFGILVKLAKVDTCLPAGRNSERPGMIAGSYLVGYGLIRLLLETVRPSEIIWKIAGVPTAQIFSVTALVVGIYLICRKRA